jgi:hypothetical protein
LPGRRFSDLAAGNNLRHPDGAIGYACAMKRCIAVLLALCLPALVWLKVKLVVEAYALATGPDVPWFHAWISAGALWLAGVLPVVLVILLIPLLWSWGSGDLRPDG